MTHSSAFTLTPRQEARGKSQSGFTLIELLVVIAIIAILSIVVVLTLSPAEMLRQSRDATRLSDMDTLNRSLGLYVTDMATQGLSLNLGNASTVYVSLIDNTSSTCGSLGLPALPMGYTYHCSSATSSRNTDGNGWLPVPLKNITTGPPLGSLPIDPQNSSSTGLYYTYITNGNQYELTSFFESQKYAKSMTSSGPDPALYAVGSNTSLPELGRGLIGYWNLDEGTGTMSYDQSGNGNNGNWSGSTPYYASGRTGLYAGNFNGTNDYINVPGITSFYANNSYTFVTWFNVAAFSPVSNPTLLRLEDGGVTGGYSLVISAGGSTMLFYKGTSATCNTSFSPGLWYHIAIIYSGAGTNNVRFFINGQSICTQSGIAVTQTGASLNINSGYSLEMLNGQIDDVRVYNRALSASEIQAIYNAEK